MILRSCFTQRVSTWMALCFMLASSTAISNIRGETPAAPPQPPKQLTTQQIEQLTLDGDRFADQGKYQQAVEKYTEAYMSVVADLRGKPFKEMVKPKLMNRVELAKEMTEQFKLELTPAELHLMEATFKVFGLAPESLNIEKTMVQLYTEEVGGFYDPRTKAMVLIHDNPSTEAKAKQKGIFDWFSKPKSSFDKEEQKTTLAHELTHALQDQLFDLESQTKLVSEDDDMTLAYSSLVEGDATLVMFVDMGRADGSSDDLLQMDPQVAEAMFGMLKMTLPMASGSTYRTAPRIFRESLLFPYMNGMAFSIYLTRRDRFREIDRAFASPPVSTEQILHPEKYLFQPDQPVTITIPETESLLGDGWNHLGGNCMGEFQTAIMLGDVDVQRKAAAGWDGDRYEVYESKQNDGTTNRAVIWASVWDSVADAEEFASTYKKYVERKIRQLNEAAKETAESTNETPNSNRWKLSIQQDDDRVILVQGLDEDLAGLVIDSAKLFTTQEKVFPTKQTVESEKAK
jgi:hypothetical protein